MPWYEYTAHGDDLFLPLLQVRLWHDDRDVRLFALVDSGADSSLFDLKYADALGLDRDDAVVEESIGASGLPFQTVRWPTTLIELQFGQERFAFNGSFIAFPPGTDTINLLGRDDFFQRFVVQFWDTARLLNIDLSPDFPRQPLSD